MLDRSVLKDIETERMTLRAPRRSDAGLIKLYLSDPKIARMLPAVPHPYPPGAAEALIERALEGRRAGGLLVMDATKSDGPELVGLVSISPDGPGVRRLGYMVGSPFWKTGFATEALEAAAGALFEAGEEALTAFVFTDDPVSARMLTNLGFSYTGEGAEHSVARGAIAPVWRYRMDRAAWARRD